MEKFICPYCGATVQAARWQTFETCTHCGREYNVSNAAEIKDGAGIAALRAALECAAEQNDCAALRTAADAVLKEIPDDFAALYYRALAEYNGGDPAPYTDFLRRADVSRAPEFERHLIAQSVVQNIAHDCERAARSFLYSALGSGGAQYYSLALERLADADSAQASPSVDTARMSANADSVEKPERYIAETNRAEKERTADAADISADTERADESNGGTRPADVKERQSPQSSQSPQCALDSVKALRMLKAYAEEYDLENGVAAAAAAVEADPESAELGYWKFVFGICDKYYIDSNEVRTDIMSDIRRTVGRAYESVAVRFEGFFGSLPGGGRKIPPLYVYEGLLPCVPDAESEYKKLIAERNEVVANAEGEISELNAIYGGRFGVSEDGRAGIDSVRNARISRVYKERDSRLADIDGAMTRLKREINDDANYLINYDMSVVERIADGCKRDTVGYALETLTPEALCDEFMPDGVERVTKICGAPTAAELTAFAYFASCSPSVFGGSAFLRLYERADDALRARLSALKAFAESSNTDICARLTAALGEKLYLDMTDRFRLELELRIQTVKTKQSESAFALAAAKKRYRKRNLFIVLFAVIAAAVVGSGLAGAIVFGSGWRAALCAIATTVACIATIATALSAGRRFAGCNAASVRDLERLIDIYKQADADFLTAKTAADSYLTEIQTVK